MLSKVKGEDLFVIGVNDEIHEDDLIKTFSSYGEVILAKIIKDKFTKKAKGIAFVKYKEKESAIRAMNNKDRIYCNGFPLTIKYNIKNKENKYFKEERGIRFNRKSDKEEKLTLSTKITVNNAEATLVYNNLSERYLRTYELCMSYKLRNFAIYNNLFFVSC